MADIQKETKVVLKLAFQNEGIEEVVELATASVDFASVHK
jgi:hypothetical protein